MDCKSTFIRPKGRAGFTLVEIMVATSLGLMAVTVVLALSYYSSRSFVAMTNYTDMGLLSQLALDNMSRQIRGAQTVTAFSTNSISLLDSAGNPFQYTYDPAGKTLSYISGGQTNVYLTECNSLEFWIYQHTPQSNTFDCYSPAYVTNARLVQVTWTCARQILGADATTESVESAEIALRNH